MDSTLLTIIIGLIAGYLGSVIMRTNYRQGIIMDIVFGVVGAILGSAIVNALGYPGVTGLDIYSIAVATLGAAIVIWMAHRFYYRDSYTTTRRRYW